MNYIVTYDLNKPGQDYSKLYNALEAFPHIRALESAWFIKSMSNAQEIYNYLAQFIDGSDNIFISQISSNYYGSLSQASWDFLSSN